MPRVIKRFQDEMCNYVFQLLNVADHTRKMIRESFSGVRGVSKLTPDIYLRIPEVTSLQAKKGRYPAQKKGFIFKIKNTRYLIFDDRQHKHSKK
eukprot:Gb_29346 [translate_table: standard]